MIRLVSRGGKSELGNFLACDLWTKKNFRDRPRRCGDGAFRLRLAGRRGGVLICVPLGTRLRANQTPGVGFVLSDLAQGRDRGYRRSDETVQTP